MRSEYVGAASALDGLASVLVNPWGAAIIGAANGNWSYPALAGTDLARQARRLAETIRSLPDDVDDPDLIEAFRGIPERISWFQGNTWPQMQGNSQIVVSNLVVLLAYIESLVPRNAPLTWEAVKDTDLIPRELSAKIRSIETALKKAAPKLDMVEGQISVIQQGYAAARGLPTDVASLEEAKQDIANIRNEADNAILDIRDNHEKARRAVQGIEAELATALKTVASIDSAYSAATTVGLAASFSARADELRNSVRYWVGWLVVTLFIGGVLGFIRLHEFQLLVGKGAREQWIWVNAGMSLLTVAAPIWFAWLATRQISQRFRLAEDYAFKASVAKAYEGYRREAARLDPALEARLFASALDRLDEAPLRFLSHEEHGSPYEALFASSGFQKMLEKFPNLRETLQTAVDHAKDAAQVVTKPKP